MFDKLIYNIKTLDYRELNGRQLTMIYTEDSGYGILSGVDEDGIVYVLKEVLPKDK